jgi:hypothetical protein
MRKPKNPPTTTVQRANIEYSRVRFIGYLNVI